MTMNFREYEETIKNTPYTDTLEYYPALMWLHLSRLPMAVASVGNTDTQIIKIPERIVNSYGNKVPVIAIRPEAFAGQSNLTDILLPQTIGRIPKGAFSGCSGLKRITIPRKVDIIREGAFAGCNQLEDVYYGGTIEEWNKINIVHKRHEIEFGDLIPGTPVQEVTAERIMNIPGNEALLSANIHFNCRLSEQVFNPIYTIHVGNKEVTDFFRTV